MVKKLVLAGCDGCRFLIEIAENQRYPWLACNCSIEHGKQRIELGNSKSVNIIEGFLRALNFSQEEIDMAHADKTREGNTTFVTIFGSRSIATAEYVDDQIIIQWETGMRKVLGTTTLNADDKRRWIAEFERLKAEVS